LDPQLAASRHATPQSTTLGLHNEGAVTICQNSVAKALEKEEEEEEKEDCQIKQVPFRVESFMECISEHDDQK